MSERKHLTVDVGARVFFYNGYIVDEDDDFLTFEDQLLGRMKINKKSILKIEECKK